mmetsp:Transcript_27975/g.42350  ORF Transcript_27975/g.42350 Transcript_27975/m.42350 type:complete len:115 (+) Transcript_27975:1077-1421(+)
MHYRKCVHKIEFCNEKRQIRTSFLESESIYVLLRVSNPTEEVMSIGTPMGNYFGTSSLDIRIDGLDQGRLIFRRLFWKALQPINSYTFFRNFASPTMNANDVYCVAYITPQIPG